VGERIAFKIDEAQKIAKALKRKRQHHDCALFSCGVDSMLRGGDLLELRVRNVTDAAGIITDTALWRQDKTDENVDLTLTPCTEEALRYWIEFSGKGPDDFLFTRKKPLIGSRPIKPGRYREVVKEWAVLIGLPPEQYSTHSLRRTKPMFLYKYGFSDIATIAFMLGHKDTATTLRYLGITKEEARRHALRGDIFKTDIATLKILTPLARDFLNPDFLDDFTEEVWARLEAKISLQMDILADQLWERLAPKFNDLLNTYDWSKK